MSYSNVGERETHAEGRNEREREDEGKTTAINC